MSTKMIYQPVFGRYVLLKRIAKGGMAEIFRAMSYGAEGFMKLVAIKRIRPELCRDYHFIDMFINEAKIVSNLSHPNIVQIFDFGRIEQALYHCMEYVHGKNLLDILRAMKERGPSAVIELGCTILLEVLNGLDQAHRQQDALGKPLNIIHRDMSPANIIVSYDGEVKIADFGIAKAAQTTIQTMGGIVKGKYKYMSPEQAQGETVDQRTDIFSAGICLYEMLTLREMYGGTSGVKLLERVRQCDYKMPRRINPAIPKELDAILLKALDKDRDKRFSTAAEFRDVLTEYLEEQRLQLSRQWLAEFMGELFKTSIDTERQQLAEEFKLAEDLRPDAAPTEPGQAKSPVKVASERTVRVSLEELEAIKKESSGPKPLPGPPSQVETAEMEQTAADMADTDLTPAPPAPDQQPKEEEVVPLEPQIKEPRSEAQTRGEIPSVKTADDTALLPPPNAQAEPAKKSSGTWRVILYIVLFLLYGGLIFLLYSFFTQSGVVLF
jgi:serine/threonine protein kinase